MMYTVLRGLAFFVLCSAVLCALLAIGVIPVSAATNIPINNSSTWSVRIDGGTAFEFIGYYQGITGDLNNNGKTDLILGAQRGTGFGRTRAGAIYVLYDDVLENVQSPGGVLDLSDPSSYSLKFVGAHNNAYTTYYPASIGDVNGDGLNDLAMAFDKTDYGSRWGAGSVYVVLSSLLDDYAGTGNVIDLADDTTWNTRLVGSMNGEYLGASLQMESDFDLDGKDDLIIGGVYATRYGRAFAGSVYIVNANLLTLDGTTGHVVDMSTTSNFTMRFDGKTANGYLFSYAYFQDGDFDGDGKKDLFLASEYDDYGGNLNTGSVFTIYSSLIQHLYDSTGTIFDLADSSTWNIQFVGSSAGVSLTSSLITDADFNGDGLPELLLGEASGMGGGSLNTGNVYVFDYPFFQSKTGIGNVVELGATTDWWIRFDGVEGQNAQIGYDNLAFDFDNDGRQDLLIDDCCNNSTAKSFIISNLLITRFTGTGNIVELADESNYSLSFTGLLSMVYQMLHPVDYNNDGSFDLAWGSTYENSLSNKQAAGTTVIVYGFPHTITQNSRSFLSGHVKISGTISAPTASSTITGVQYASSANPLGVWSACQADDGAFDSKLENYTCSISGEERQSVYIRAQDSWGIYTPVSRYVLSSIPGEITNESTRAAGNGEPIRPHFFRQLSTWVKQVLSGGGQVMVLTPESGIDFDGNVTVSVTPKQVPKSVVYGGVEYWQVSDVYEVWLKEFTNQAKILPSIQTQPSILAFSYRDDQLIAPGNSPFKAEKLRLAQSDDEGKTWFVLSNSVVNVWTKTVAAIVRPGGWYMVVGTQ